jgi:hypothetical protein
MLHFLRFFFFYNAQRLFKNKKSCDLGYARGTCTSMFIAVLFTIGKLWKQPRCPTTDMWFKKMWYCTQWNFTQPWRRIKSFYSQVNGWNWGTSSWVRLARLRRPKIIHSSSYVDFRFRPNAAVFWDLGRVLRGEHKWEKCG